MLADRSIEGSARPLSARDRLYTTAHHYARNATAPLQWRLSPVRFRLRLRAPPPGSQAAADRRGTRSCPIRATHRESFALLYPDRLASTRAHPLSQGLEHEA